MSGKDEGVTETCVCGGSITVTATFPADAGERYIRVWRTDHQHLGKVGICGNMVPGIGGEGTFCTLEHGHDGLHGDASGAHWGLTSDLTP